MKTTQTYGNLLMDVIATGLGRFVLMKKKSLKVRLARRFKISKKYKWLYYDKKIFKHIEMH